MTRMNSLSRAAPGTWQALGQVLQAEEHALAGAATDVGGRDPDLCGMSHEVLES